VRERDLNPRPISKEFKKQRFKKEMETIKWEFEAIRGGGEN